jgi:hypothetical protein
MQAPHRSFLWELGMLMWRSLLEVVRSPSLFIMHQIFAVIVGLLVGFVYFRQEEDTAGG